MAQLWIESDDCEKGMNDGHYECSECGQEYPSGCKCITNEVKNAINKSKEKPLDAAFKAILNKENK